MSLSRSSVLPRGPSGGLPRAADAPHEAEQRRALARALLRRLHELPEPRRAHSRARAELVELHMPLVIHLARRFAGRSEPLDDLIQVASLGLLKAIDRFDVSRNLEFSTYATPTIVGEIKRHFRDTGWLVHVPRGAQELQATVRAARDDLSQKLGRSPTTAELASHLDIDDDAVVEAFEVTHAYAAVPIEVFVPPGESAPEHPSLARREAGYERTEHRQLLRQAMRRLADNEREMLALRFFDNLTQTEIAARMGVSQMQVSRVIRLR